MKLQIFKDGRSSHYGNRAAVPAMCRLLYIYAPSSLRLVGTDFFPESTPRPPSDPSEIIKTVISRLGILDYTQVVCEEGPVLGP